MDIGDLVLVYDCPQGPEETIGVITGVDQYANDFAGDLDADLYRVYIAEQSITRYFTNRNLVLLSKTRRKNDNLCRH
jgi:hypothetical protein